MSATLKPNEKKEGFILFYVMGALAVLALAALISTSSATLESRTARNHMDTVRSLYHAEAGVKLVQRTVENRLMAGESLSEILQNLSVEAPTGIEFDTIDNFQEIVPGRLFTFESIGRSDDAMASVMVQFRRRPLLTAGLFGVTRVNTRSNVKIFGYDSRLFINPTEDNGGASIGSNFLVALGNNNLFSGLILLGDQGEGMLANCSGCSLFTQVNVGEQDPDPLGLTTTNGTMAEIFEQAVVSNDNHRARFFDETVTGNPISADNRLHMNTNSRPVVLEAGTYYLKSVEIGNHTTLHIDDTDGPVIIYLDGPFDMTTQANLENEIPWNLQIYSRVSDTINFQPNISVSAFIYAPLANINLQPSNHGNHVRGAFWGNDINVQPGTNGAIWLDTSLAERMLMNNLEIHAWYEQHIN
ncbi:MAG: hypothetical protein JJU05_06045 [Verrucomicrobia bacterium]|nr:hypothetical protein [Verrucomicrobiota bacterium]MCH8526935.1 hypothetical protein [Kiritimatiellia bacterium]